MGLLNWVFNANGPDYLTLLNPKSKAEQKIASDSKNKGKEEEEIEIGILKNLGGNKKKLSQELMRICSFGSDMRAVKTLLSSGRYVLFCCCCMSVCVCVLCFA